MLTGEDDDEDDLPSTGFPLNKISSMKYYRSPRRRIRSGLIETLFSLPQLRCLSLRIGRRSWSQIALSPHCPSLRQLVLKDVYLEEGFIGQFLDSAPNLRDLRLELVRSSEIECSFSQLNLSPGGGIIHCHALEASIANTNMENYLLPLNSFTRQKTTSLEGFQLFQTPRRKLLENLAITTNFVTYNGIDIPKGGGGFDYTAHTVPFY